MLVNVGNQYQFFRQVQTENCYGQTSEPFPTGASPWLALNPEYGTITGDGLAEAIAPGTAQFSVTWMDFRWYEWGIGNCEMNEVPGSGSGEMEVPPQVQKIQYQEPGSSNFIDITGTLYILKGTSVTFKAIPNPPNSTFPSGSPAWSGTSGASGTGATISVTFNTASSSTSDYKTVIASSGNSITVNAVVYELIGTLNPQEYFFSRSNARYGLAEKVNLGFIASPNITAQQIGGLQWKIVLGQGILNNTVNGVDVYTAPETAEGVTLKLELLAGPSKMLGPSYDKTIVAPSGALIRRHPNDPTVWHCQGFCSAGFFAEFRLEPKDVSFSNLFFREGFVMPSIATGYYFGSRTYAHSATPFMTPISDCNIYLGCKAFEDRVWTGRGYPPFSYGEFEWRIPLLYAFVNDLDPTINRERPFDIGVHYQTADSAGTATIQKNQAGPFSALVNDPDVNCQPQ